MPYSGTWLGGSDRTMGLIPASTSCYLSGVGQVTLSFVLLFSHLSNEDIDIIPTPLWVVGRLNHISQTPSKIPCIVLFFPPLYFFFAGH